MGCVCCSLSSFVSIVLHALERITLCTVCAMLVCCVLFTIMAVLIMGVGIGFHYCEVQNSVEAMANAAKAASALDKEDPEHKNALRSVNQAVKRGFAHRLGRRDRSDQLMPSNNNTVNDVLLGRNDTSRRAKRHALTLDLAPNSNDTEFTNESITYEYDDDNYSDNDTLRTEELSVVPSNVSIHDAILIRQNCTLLNFFTRFLQF